VNQNDENDIDETPDLNDTDKSQGFDVKPTEKVKLQPPKNAPPKEELRGNPAKDHAKTLGLKLAAQAKAKREAQSDLEAKLKAAKQEGLKAELALLASQPVIYTTRGDKVLEIKVTPSGTYTTYLGNKSKYKDTFDALQAKFESAEVWVEGDKNVARRIKELREKMAKG